MSSQYDVADWAGPSMGGMLAVAVAADPAALRTAREAAERVGRRVNAWASRLTRFASESDLCRLNAHEGQTARVRPTLGSALAWARTASASCGGLVDVTLLDARLRAEAVDADAGAASHTSDDWSIECAGRTARVSRAPGVHFDLDGVAKGWLADRASWLLSEWPGAFVDADGDIALAANGDVEWLIDVVDPRRADSAPLATLRFGGTYGWRRTAGVATSGTTVHRWQFPGQPATHHLIDPRTGSPADTDVVQATVVAPTAREAEVMAKAAVILGSADGMRYLERSAAHAALLLLESGELAQAPGTQGWLA